MTEIDLAAIDAERERIRARYLLSATQRPAPSARGVHHVALLCADVERTVRFYQEVLEPPLPDIFETRDNRVPTLFFCDSGNGTLRPFFPLPGLALGPY